MINKEVKVITCHGIVVDKYAICPLWHSLIDLSIHPFLRMFAFFHAGTDPPSQPASRLSSHFNHSFHLFAFFHFFHSLFILSFVRSFVVHWFVLFSLIIDIFSLSDDTFLDTIFRIRCLTRHTKNLFLLKNRHNGRRSWGKSVIP